MRNRLLSFFVVCAACIGAGVTPDTATAQVLAAPVPDGAWTPAPAGKASSPFEDLFSDTIRDFARVPSRETATLLSIGAVAAMLGHQLDRPVSQGLSASPMADTAFGWGETIGSARLQFAGAVATYAVGRLTNARTGALGADLIRAQILTQTLTLSIKSAAGRTRPDGTQYSFPSGHSSTTFATATVLQRHFGWKAGVPAYVLATYVATSRIQDRRHFLSDVMFGAALGVVAGRTVTIGQGNHRFEITPSVLPRGGGVNLTWVP